MTTTCTKCGETGHAAQDHAWDAELRAADRARAAKAPKQTFTAEIDYTVEVRRGRHEIPIRKTKAVRAGSREKLGPAVAKAQEKLSDVGAYAVVVRWPVASDSGEVA